jgi:hypothetical protein
MQRSAFAASRLRIPSLFLLLAILSGTDNLFAQSFTRASFTSTTVATNGPAIGDFNEDGLLDYAMPTQVPGLGLAIFINHGNAQFTNDGDHLYPTGGQPTALVVADFNNDGHLDIAVASAVNATDGNITIFYGKGDGTFILGQTVEILGGIPNSITTTSINNSSSSPFGDFLIDLAVANDGSNDIVTLVNAGNVPNAFSIAQRFVPANGQPIANITSADFDQNGWQDLAFITKNGSSAVSHLDSIYIVLSNGNGHYGTAQVVTQVINAWGLQAVSLGKTTYPDLLVGHAFGSSDGGVLAIFNHGSGHYTFHDTLMPVSYTSNRPLAADFNGDGIPDWIVGVVGDTTSTAVAFGKADGTFQAPVFFAGPHNGVAVGSFQPGALKYDFAGVDGRSSGVDVYFNDDAHTACAPNAKTGFHICERGTLETNGTARIQASATMANPVDHIELWSDGQKLDQVFGSHIDKEYTFSAGSHTATLVALDQAGNIMKQSFQTTGTGSSCSTGDAVINSPGRNGGTVPNPVKVDAAAETGGGCNITAMRLYVDNQSFLTVPVSAPGAGFTKSVNLATGFHTLVIVAWNNQGVAFTSSPVMVFVAGQDMTVYILSPGSGATVSNPVTITARTRWDNSFVNHLRAYVDNVDIFDADSDSFSFQTRLSAGSHFLVVIGWNNGGQFIKSSETFVVH